MQAIGYRRVSTAGQIDGEGLGVQTQKIEGWCKFQNLDLIGIYEDAGMSGANMNRPGLQDALSTVTTLGKEGVLVVGRLDRLGRNAIEVQTTLRDLLNAGVRVVAIGDGIDTSSGMGASILKLLISILSSFAELERDVIRTRLLDGRQRAKSENRVYSCEPQIGLRVADDGRTLVESSTEVAAIQRARSLRRQGTSFRAIATILDGEGYRPRRAPKWQAAVVRRLILRDPIAA